MSWQFALGILVVIQTASIILTKLTTDRIAEKSVGVFHQYLFCAIITIVYALISEKLYINSIVLGVGAIGLLNGIGSYFQWKTSGLSLSKTALFFPLMEVMTIILAVMFLGEGMFWNTQLIFGSIICFLVMIYFGLPKKRENEKEKKESSKWFVYATAMIVIFGMVGFFLKFFSDKVPRETFIMGFYVGAFLGSIILLFVEKKNPIHISKKTLLLILPVSITITAAVLVIYLTYQLGGPISLVIPIRGLAITVLPIVAGWILFKEIKKFNKRDLLAFAAGLIGVLLVLFR